MGPRSRYLVCRRAVGRKPHSRARIDGSVGVSARRTRGCRSPRTTSRFKKRALRGKGAGGRGPSSRDSKEPGGRKGVDNQSGGGQATTLGSLEPGVRKGIAGRRSSQDGRRSGPLIRIVRSCERCEGGLGGSREGPHARASWSARGARQGCQRLGVHARRRDEQPADVMRSKRPRAVHRSDSHCRETGDSSIAPARKRSTQGEPTMRGYSYEEVRWQKSVQRIERFGVGEPQGNPRAGRWPRSTPQRVLAHAAGTSW